MAARATGFTVIPQTGMEVSTPVRNRTMPLPGLLWVGWFVLQSLETTRSLDEIDRELILGVVKAFFAARVKGDIDRMAEMVAHDVVCFPPSSWSCARYPRELVGREAFREAFKLRHINYIVLQSQIHFILVDGAEAAVHRSVTLRERGGGPPHSFDVINFLRFRSGSIVEFVELPDGSACDVVNNFPH